MNAERPYYWTTPELAVVRKHYPAGGCKACRTLLPHRSPTSIYQQAAKIGVRSKIQADTKKNTA